MWKYFGGKIAGSLCGLQKLICKRQFSEVCNLDAMRTSFGRTTLCGQTSRFIGQNVTLMGWLTANRSINKHHRFLLLHDWSGDVQVTFSSELQNMQLLESVLELPLNSVLSISGKVQQRANAHQNPSMKTGDIEVIAESIDVLNKYTSSVIFETSGTKRTANEEFRLKYRYLDFRREVMQRNLRMRSNFCAKVRSFLISQMDFVEIETPSLVRETPGGANEFLVTSKFKGEFFTLPQSPQLFKQLLMVGGFDRYFQVAKCYRDEDLKSDRQPEFTQLDLEMAFATADDVICVIENCLKELLVPYMPQLVLPFDRISYAKAIRLYGSDKPDRRIPGTLHNITDMFFKSKSFSSSEIVKANDFLYCIVVKDSSLSNTSLSKQYRLTNFQNISHARVHHDNTFKFASHQLASQFNEHAQDYLRNELQLQDCDLIVFAWGSNELQVCQALGLLRTSLSKQSNLNMDMDIFWVEDFPLFEIDESSCLSSAHHPFTAPHIEDEHLLFQEGADLTKVRGQHYDLVMNGNEIGGGSVRIHSAHTQSRIFDILDLDPSTMSALLEGLSSGAPPHAGIALGLDRILAILCNANSIRDVIAFPKASSGRDLLFQAPTIPSKDALQRYFLNNFNFGDIDK